MSKSVFCYFKARQIKVVVVGPLKKLYFNAFIYLDLSPKHEFNLSRLERDLYGRTDQFGVEIRERVKWDIREAMVSTVSNP